MRCGRSRGFFWRNSDNYFAYRQRTSRREFCAQADLTTFQIINNLISPCRNKFNYFDCRRVRHRTWTKVCSKHAGTKQTITSSFLRALSSMFSVSAAKPTTICVVLVARHLGQNVVGSKVSVVVKRSPITYCCNHCNYLPGQGQSPLRPGSHTAAAGYSGSNPPHYLRSIA